MKIGIVAAEPSGDLLAAGLMSAIRHRHPQVRFEGIGGSRMQEQGMESWFPMEKLSIMGLVEVLRHLPELMKIRGALIARWRDQPPDLFIGVDAPDFNLTLEQQLRDAAIPTVHYVSPTVWAWRTKRVIKLRKAADLVLSIFPFEESFLSQHGVNTRYVGHPLAQDIPMQPDRAAARQELELDPHAPVLALLPGSRGAEVSSLARPFLLTAVACAQQLPGLRVVTPLATAKTAAVFESARQAYAPDLKISTFSGSARQVLTASDVVLTASGTATFEALLCKRPMVVGYKVHWLTYWIARLMKLVKTEHVAMANILASDGLAPEFIQHACEPEQLVPAVMHWFEDGDDVKRVKERYCEVHRSLSTDTNREAASAVLSLLGEH